MGVSGWAEEVAEVAVVDDELELEEEEDEEEEDCDRDLGAGVSSGVEGGGGTGAEMDMGIGILDGGLKEGIERLVRGRGRKKVDQREPFGVGGGVGGAMSGTRVKEWGRDEDVGGWYPVCGRGLCLDEVDRVRGRGEGEEGEAFEADAARGLG